MLVVLPSVPERCVTEQRGKILVRGGDPLPHPRRASPGKNKSVSIFMVRVLLHREPTRHLRIRRHVDETSGSSMMLKFSEEIQRASEVAAPPLSLPELLDLRRDEAVLIDRSVLRELTIQRRVHFPGRVLLPPPHQPVLVLLLLNLVEGLEQRTDAVDDHGVGVEERERGA